MGCLMGIFALAVCGIMAGCGSPFGFGSAGNSGIDTVGSSDPLVMQTTDSTLIPELNYPNGSDTGVSLLPVLSWNKVNGASKYRVFMSGNSDFIVNTLIVNDLTNNNFDTVGGALPYGASYYWVVCAVGANGHEAWSNVAHFMTQPLLPLQNAYVAQKFGMFIHFNMSTFARYELPYSGRRMGTWK